MIHKAFAVAAVSGLVVACGDVVSGNSSYVTIGYAKSETSAAPRAEAHCAKYGKAARYRPYRDDRYTFDDQYLDGEKTFENRYTFDCVSP
jgi:hypothetical protein